MALAKPSINRIPNLHAGNQLAKRKAIHRPKPDAPGSESAKFAARHKDPRIDVRIFKRPDETYYAQFSFYSRMQANHLLRGEVELRGSESELEFEVGVLCGAMAERLGELHGDNFDPDEAARVGSKNFINLLRAWEAAK